MSRIVQAVNSMIANRHLISKVVQRSTEIYFLYNGKYVWSILKAGDIYNLFYYPDADDPKVLAALDDEDWNGVPLVAYSDQEIGTREAEASFAELYGIVNEMVYGVDAVLDDIISNS